LNKVPAAMQHKVLVDVVNKNNLLDQVKQVGVILLDGLKKIQSKDQRVLNARAYFILNIRMGTFGSSIYIIKYKVDCVDPLFRDRFIKNLRNNGY
jgi:hypothetical protein